VDLIHPHSIHDVEEAVRDAARLGTRLLLVGGRVNMDKGNPSEVDAELWTTLLDDVASYDPAEMIAVVEAGMRARDLRHLLSEGGQEWPVDAPDDATVGGVIAAGIDPVRRLRVGTTRDSVVEMEIVTGDGRRIRTGARTVKNVTGYDVHRLLTGSLGTLGCIVQVALKVRPLPKEARTLVAREGGFDLGERLLGAVPLPAAVLAEPDRVVLRLEGWPEEVDEQAAFARGVTDMDDADPETFPEPLPEAPIVAEVSVAPSQLARVLDGHADRWRALMGTGTAWVGVRSMEELHSLRQRVAESGGIAPVIRGEGGLGDAPVAAVQIQRGIKGALDPLGIMAPGRFWSGL
jgi:glycolate oxidase FAD binding subunit